MSATNRGGERLKDDCYYTPDALALACCKVLDDEGVFPDRVLEPSVGSGAWLRAVQQVWPRKAYPESDWDLLLREGVDVNPGSWTTHLSRFEDFSAKGWDLIIGNPPYSLAEQHIRHAMTLLAPGGTLAFLLRINFLGSKARSRLWRDHPISSLYVLRPRPSFTGGQSDATEYALFVWGNPKQGVQWIDWDNGIRKRKAGATNGSTKTDQK